MIKNEREFNDYKNWFIQKWKPIIDEEREKSGDGYKAIRKNFDIFFDDYSPLFEYVCICYFQDRINSLVDIKDFK